MTVEAEGFVEIALSLTVLAVELIVESQIISPHVCLLEVVVAQPILINGLGIAQERLVVWRFRQGEQIAVDPYFKTLVAR